MTIPDTLMKKRDPIDGIFEELTDDLKKLHELCMHYGIEEDDPAVRFLLLSLKLAKEYIPAFQDKVKKGRNPIPIAKAVHEMQQIYHAVQKKVLEENCTENEACELLDED